jgi:peptidoglycan/xylan/chitin deacetylase (PgdA/CDA1 family)
MWRLARRRPLVLLYHRVADLELDPWGLAVRPVEFARHVRLLSRLFTIVPLASLVPGREAAAGSSGRLAITFDDGYRDNADTAWPVLQQYGLPATFFISCSTLDSGRELWWDTLERLLLWPGTLPARLTVMSAGVTTRRPPPHGMDGQAASAAGEAPCISPAVGASSRNERERPGSGDRRSLRPGTARYHGEGVAPDLDLGPDPPDVSLAAG